MTARRPGDARPERKDIMNHDDELKAQHYRERDEQWESEIPEAIRNLQLSERSHPKLQGFIDELNLRNLESYRRGQKDNDPDAAIKHLLVLPIDMLWPDAVREAYRIGKSERSQPAEEKQP